MKPLSHPLPPGLAPGASRLSALGLAAVFAGWPAGARAEAPEAAPVPATVEAATADAPAGVGFFETLKEIPLGADGDVRLSIGGEVRQQFEAFGAPGFDDSRDDAAYLLQRYTLDLDVAAWERVRGFVQLYSAPVAFQDEPPGPFDEELRRGCTRPTRS